MESDKEKRNQWSSAHAELWTSIEPTQTHSAPARSPPRVPPPARQQPADDDSVDLSELTVAGDTSVASQAATLMLHSSAANANASIDRDGIIRDLQSQLSEKKREVEALRSGQDRIADYIKDVARDIRNSVGVDVSQLDFRQQPLSPQRGIGGSIPVALEELFGAIEGLQMSLVEQQNNADFERSRCEEHETSFRQNREEFDSRLAAAVAGFVDGLVPEAAEPDETNPLLRLAAAQERLNELSGQVMQLMVRRHLVAVDAIPDALSTRIVSLTKALAGELPVKAKLGEAPAEAASGRPQAHPPVGEEVAAKALSAVIDVLGGGEVESTISPSEALKVACDLALRLTKSKEEATREASAASFALSQFERNVTRQLANLGARPIVRADQLKDAMRQASNDPRRLRDIADNEAEAESMWLQGLVSRSSRVLSRIGQRPMTRPPTGPGDTTAGQVLSPQKSAAQSAQAAVAVREEVERVWTAMEDSLAAALGNQDALRRTAAAATRVAERVIGVPQTYHADPGSIEALAAKATELGSFDDQVLGRIRAMVSLLPPAFRVTDDSPSMTQVLDAAAAAIRHSGALVSEYTPDAVEQLKLRVDRICTQEGGWSSVLALAPDPDSEMFHVAQSASVEDSIDRLEQRMRHVATVTEPIAQRMAADGSDGKMLSQHVTMKLLRVLNTNGGLPPTAGGYEERNAHAVDDLVAMIDSRLEELRTTSQRLQKSESRLKNERTAIEQVLLEKGGAVAAEMNTALESETAVATPDIKAASGNGKSAIASALSTLLSSVQTGTGELRHRLSRSVASRKADKVRVDNYTADTAARQKQNKKLISAVGKLASLLSLDEDDVEGLEPAEILEKATLRIAERDGSSDGGVDAIALAAENAKLKETMTDKDQIFRESYLIVLQHFGVVARETKTALVAFSPDEPPADDVVMAAAEASTESEYDDDAVEEMLRVVMGKAKRWAGRLASHTVNHLEAIQKIATYHQAIHQTITKTRSEKHDGTINDVDACLVQYADDVLLALESGGGGLKSDASVDGSPSRGPTGPSDHRLVRLHDAVQKLRGVASGLLKVRYLTLASNTASEGEYVDVPVDDIGTDELIRVLERNLQALLSQLTEFGGGLKTAAIVLEKDIDALQRDLATVVGGVASLPDMEALYKLDKAELEGIYEVLSDKSSQRGMYFFNRPDGTGVCPWALAAKYVAAAFSPITERLVDRTSSSRHFKNIVEAMIDDAVEFIRWHSETNPTAEVPTEVTERDLPKIMASMLEILRKGANPDALEDEVSRLTEQLKAAEDMAALNDERRETDAETHAATVKGLQRERDAALSDAALARAQLKRMGGTPCCPPPSATKRGTSAVAAEEHGLTEAQYEALYPMRVSSSASKSNRNASPAPQQKSAGRGSNVHAATPPPAAVRMSRNHTEPARGPVGSYATAVESEIAQRHLYSPARLRRTRSDGSTGTPRHQQRMRVTPTGRIETSPTRNAKAKPPSSAGSVSAPSSTLMAPTASAAAKRHGKEQSAAQTQRPAARSSSASKSRAPATPATPASQVYGESPASRRAATTNSVSANLASSQPQGGQWVDVPSQSDPVQQLPWRQNPPPGTNVQVTPHQVRVVEPNGSSGRTIARGSMSSRK